MQDKIRYGILSTASTVKRFASAMEETGTGKVTAIASRTQLRAEEAAAALGIPTAYSDYHELLKDPDIDADPFAMTSFTLGTLTNCPS